MGTLNAQIVGSRVFDSTPVTVTDPCYKAGTWCTLKAQVKPGTYACVAWKGRVWTTNPVTGKRTSHTQIFGNGIYLDGKIPKQDVCVKIGEIGVDAGLAGFFQDKPDYKDEAWFQLCDAVHIKNWLITKEGFFTQSGWGDGTYSVYAFKDKNGDITGLEINFGDE